MATKKPANELNAQFRNQDIPLELIDEPQKPERETMDERELGELALSIQEVGLLEALVVKPVGERFEVIAGHRRLLACRIISYTPVPCRVRISERVSALSMLVHENAHREDVNAVEEARFYARLLEEECNNDVDALCILVKRNRGFVEDRLILLMGWPKVVEALAQKRISIAVARCLNKVKDENRLNILLDTAMNQGVSARQAEIWVRDANLQDPIALPQPGDVDPNAEGSQASVPYTMQCLFCGGNHEQGFLELLYMHKPCCMIVKRALNLDAGDRVQPVN